MKRLSLPLALVAAPCALSAETARFTQTGPLSSDTGYAAIEWSAPGPVTLRLANTDDRQPARTLYSGANNAYFVSGLADGDYVLTLHNNSGETSTPLRLAVRHQSLGRALILAGLGALIFLAIVATILAGARDD